MQQLNQARRIPNQLPESCGPRPRTLLAGEIFEKYILVFQGSGRMGLVFGTAPADYCLTVLKCGRVSVREEGGK
jgi:hypothetical protein